MNRKLLLVSICMMLLMVLCSCVGNNSIKPAPDSETGMNANTATSNESSITPTPGPAAESNENKTATEKNYTDIGFDILSKELAHIMNNAKTADEVVKLIGEPEEKSDAEVWEADGLEHETWFYNALGLELDFTTDNTNVQKINSAYICSPSGLKTTRGVGIGSTKDEVQKAYAEEINLEESKTHSEAINADIVVVGSVYGGVVFTFENDKVATIFIGASAE